MFAGFDLSVASSKDWSVGTGSYNQFYQGSFRSADCNVYSSQFDSSEYKYNSQQLVSLFTSVQGVDSAC